MSYTTPGASSPSSMTSTFTLLMKIVRDLALNRDDPDGREHHKHFVEQQFINSNVRIDRVINESNNDLTKLIQIFDLILRRTERTRRELSTFLFSIRNCKQLLLVRRSECRKLWFKSVEQNTLVNIYDELMELTKVKSRCQIYLSSGYLVHAVELVELAMHLFDEKFSTSKFDPEEMFDDPFSTTTAAITSVSGADDFEDGENRQIYYDINKSKDSKRTLNSMKELKRSRIPPSDHSENDHRICFSKSTANFGDGSDSMGLNSFHHIRDEIYKAGEDIFRSLKIALEVGIFDGIFDRELLSKVALGSTESSNNAASPKATTFVYGFDPQCDQINSRVWWSQDICSLWRSIHKQKNVFVANSDAADILTSTLPDYNYPDDERTSSNLIASATEVNSNTVGPTMNFDQLESDITTIATAKANTTNANCVLSNALSFETDPTVLTNRPAIFNSFKSKSDYINYIVICAKKLTIVPNALDKIKNHITNVFSKRLDSILVAHASALSSYSSSSTTTTSLFPHLIHLNTNDASSANRNVPINTDAISPPLTFSNRKPSIITSSIKRKRNLLKNVLTGDPNISSFPEASLSLNLATLLTRTYEHYEQIAESCQILIYLCNQVSSSSSFSYPSQTHSQLNEDFGTRENKIQKNNILSLPLSMLASSGVSECDNQLKLTSSFIWSMIQRPLVAVLLIHLINDLEDIVQKQNVFSLYADIFVDLSTGRKHEFNSELILRICSKIKHQLVESISSGKQTLQPIRNNKTWDDPTTTSEFEDTSSDNMLSERLPIDFDAFFIDSNVPNYLPSQNNSLHGSGNIIKSTLLAGSAKTSTSHAHGYHDHNIGSNFSIKKMPIGSSVTSGKHFSLLNLEGRLFKFNRSAQFQSLSQYYKDLGDQKKYGSNQLQTIGGSSKSGLQEGGGKVLTTYKNSEKVGSTRLPDFANISTDSTFASSHSESIDIINSIKDFLGIAVVMVCPPSYRNIHFIYHNLMHICALIDKQIECYVTGDSNNVKNIAATTDSGNDNDSPNIIRTSQDDNYLHLSLLKDNIRYFIRDVYFLKLRNDIHTRMEENLTSSASITELISVDGPRHHNVNVADSISVGGSDRIRTVNSSPADDNLSPQHGIPVFLHTFLSLQAIDELVFALYDMNAYTSEFWIAINEIILQHTETCSNVLFDGNTMMRPPVCIEWVRDVDVNRHLRSMPMLRVILDTRQHGDIQSSTDASAPSTMQSLLFDLKTVRRKTFLLTAGQLSSSSLTGEMKNAQSIISNLVHDEQFISDRIITDYRNIRTMANQHESMIWFVNEFDQIIRRTRNTMINNRSIIMDDHEDNLSYEHQNQIVENELVSSSIQNARHVADDILLTIYVEVRAHCFYHLLNFSNPNNLIQYATEASSNSDGQSNFINQMMNPLAENSNLQPQQHRPHYIQYNFQEAAKPIDRKADFSLYSQYSGDGGGITAAIDENVSGHLAEDNIIQALCRDLIRLQESLLGALSLPKLEFILSGLGYLFAVSFIELADKFSTISDQGIRKMRRNILSVYTCLLNLSHQRTFASNAYQRQKRSSSDYFLPRQFTNENDIIFNNYQQNDSALFNFDNYKSQMLSQPAAFTMNSMISSNRSFDDSGDNGELRVRRSNALITTNNSNQERKELLRALHFYDLLKCANVKELLRRIETEYVPNQFREQDYRSLVSLKFRNDHSNFTASTLVGVGSSSNKEFKAANSSSISKESSSLLDETLSQLNIILAKHSHYKKQDSISQPLASSIL